MVDYTKCQDETCPLRDKCYRYMAHSNEAWQSYFMHSPREGDECREFVKIKVSYFKEEDE